MGFCKLKTSVMGLCTLFVATNAANILGILSVPAMSHFFHMKAIMTSLHEAGHRITFIHTFSDHEQRPDYTNVNYSYVNPNLKVEKENPIFPVTIWKSMPLWNFLKFCFTFYEAGCHSVMKLPEIQDTLKSDKKRYDVIFVEMVFAGECFLPLAEKLKIPIIGVIPLWATLTTEFAIGNPTNPAVHPYELSSNPEGLSSIYGRLRNSLDYITALTFHYFHAGPQLNAFYRQHYPNSELTGRSKMSLLFAYGHSSFFARPLAANVVDIGGIDIKPVKPLPKDILKFIEESEHDVILFTMGSTVRGIELGQELVETFAEAFAEIPQRVIWKFEEKLGKVSNNVLLMDWLPQRDIIAHKKVKVFMGHGGITGIYEAIDAGKPMLLFPVFGDQPMNSAILQKLGGGIRMDIFSLTKRKLVDALNEILNNTKYRENMEALSFRFKDRPMTPQQSAVYWTEYVIRHKGAFHLRTAAADTPLYQYLLLDVVALIILLLATILFAVRYIVRKTYTLLFTKSEDKHATNLKKKKL